MHTCVCVCMCVYDSCVYVYKCTGIVKKRVEKDVTTKIGECVDQGTLPKIDSQHMYMNLRIFPSFFLRLTR